MCPHQRIDALGVAFYLGTQFLTTRTAWRTVSIGSATIAALIGSILLISSAGDRIHATRVLSHLITLNAEPDSSVKTVRSITTLDQELAAARADGKPVMLDFSADWCIECRAMDAVFRKPEVQERLQSFRVIRADVTAVNDASRTLMQRFEIVGPPTILLFGTNGSVAPTTRIVGAVDSNTLLAKLSTIKSLN